MVRIDVKVRVTRSRVAGQNYAGPGRDAKKLTLTSTQNLTLETIDGFTKVGSGDVHSHTPPLRGVGSGILKF